MAFPKEARVFGWILRGHKADRPSQQPGAADEGSLLSALVGVELRHWIAAREILAKRELAALGEDPTLMPGSAAAPVYETYARPAAGELALSMEGQAVALALSGQKGPVEAPRRRSKPA
jgi:hypothetical protein